MSDGLIRIVEFLAHLNISQILIGRVSLTPVIMYYGIIVFAGFVVLRRPRIERVITLTTVLTIIIYLGAAKCQRNYRNDLVMTCLDVGHGQAILARLPGKTNISFDAGSLHRRDVGTRIVAPYLEYNGIDKIDAVIISHNDIDHINGIPEIVEHCRVKRLYANDDFFERADVWGTAKFLHDWISQKGLDIEPLRGNPDLNSSANLQILWPDRQTVGKEMLSENDRSLVFCIEFSGVRILLCSDIEVFAQQELLRRYPTIKADVVVVPHHGSAATLVPEFINKLDASILICSCDRRQYERTRNGFIPTAKSQGRAKQFFTFKDGAVSVRINRDGSLRTERFIK